MITSTILFKQWVGTYLNHCTFLLYLINRHTIGKTVVLGTIPKRVPNGTLLPSPSTRLSVYLGSITAQGYISAVVIGSQLKFLQFMCCLGMNPIL